MADGNIVEDKKHANGNLAYIKDDKGNEVWFATDGVTVVKTREGEVTSYFIDNKKEREVCGNVTTYFDEDENKIKRETVIKGDKGNFVELEEFFLGTDEVRYKKDKFGNEYWYRKEYPHTLYEEKIWKKEKGPNGKKERVINWYAENGQTKIKTRDSQATVIDYDKFGRKVKKTEKVGDKYRVTTYYEDGIEKEVTDEKGSRTLFRSDGTKKAYVDKVKRVAYQYRCEDESVAVVITPQGAAYVDSDENKVYEIGTGGKIIFFEKDGKTPAFTFDGPKKEYRIDPDSGVMIFLDENKKKICEIDPKGNVTKFENDKKVKTINKDGKTIAEYYESGRKKWEINKKGDEIFYRDDFRNTKEKIVDEAKYTTVFYDDGKTVKNEKDDKGNEIFYRNDKNHTKEKEVLAEGDEIGYFEDGKTVRYEKNSEGDETWYRNDEEHTKEKNITKEYEVEFFEDGKTIKFLKDKINGAECEWWPYEAGEKPKKKCTMDSSGLETIYDKDENVLFQQRYWDREEGIASYMKDENGTESWYRNDEEGTLEKKIDKNGNGFLYGEDGSTIVGRMQNGSEILYFEGTEIPQTRRDPNGYETYYRKDKTVSKTINEDKEITEYFEDGLTPCFEDDGKGHKVWYAKDENGVPLKDEDGRQLKEKEEVEGKVILFENGKPVLETSVAENKENAENSGSGAVEENKNEEKTVENEKGVAENKENAENSGSGAAEENKNEESGTHNEIHNEEKNANGEGGKTEEKSLSYENDGQGHEIWRNKQGYKVEEIDGNVKKLYWGDENETVKFLDDEDNKVRIWFDEAGYKLAEISSDVRKVYYGGSSEVLQYIDDDVGHQVWYTLNLNCDVSVENCVIPCALYQPYTDGALEINQLIELDNLMQAVNKSANIKDDISRHIEVGYQKCSLYSPIDGDVVYLKDGDYQVWYKQDDSGETIYNEAGKKLKDTEIIDGDKYVYRYDDKNELLSYDKNGVTYRPDGFRETGLSRARKKLAQKTGLEKVKLPKGLKKLEDKTAKFLDKMGKNF